jgi:hypothetical protein
MSDEGKLLRGDVLVPQDLGDRVPEPPIFCLILQVGHLKVRIELSIVILNNVNIGAWHLHLPAGWASLKPIKVLDWLLILRSLLAYYGGKFLMRFPFRGECELLLGLHIILLFQRQLRSLRDLLRLHSPLGR